MCGDRMGACDSAFDFVHAIQLLLQLACVAQDVLQNALCRPFVPEVRSVRLGAPYTSRCKERIFFNLANRVVDFVLEALDLVLQWLLLLPFLHELRCKAGDFSALCTTAQAKHGGLPASFEQIELIPSSVLSRKATASTSTPSGFVPCLSTSLQSIASEGKPSKAAVARSSKTRNPKGREAVEGDAPPDSRRAGRQASADLLMHDSLPSEKKRNPEGNLSAIH